MLERGDASAEDIDIAMKLGAGVSRYPSPIFVDAHGSHPQVTVRISGVYAVFLLLNFFIIIAMGPIELTDFVGLDTSALSCPLPPSSLSFFVPHLRLIANVPDRNLCSEAHP